MRRATGFADSDGERIYYEDVGAGEPTVVLCHGAGGNHAVWYQQVPVFTSRRRAIGFDQRGFGRSTARGGPNRPDAFDWIARFLGVNASMEEFEGRGPR